MYLLYKKISALFLSIAFLCSITSAQNKSELDKNNITWSTQSKNSSESMPCGGGDIGLNVWVENNELLFYFSRSGTFDETNALLKLGRVRINLSPNPFQGKIFQQKLVLKDGNVVIKATNGKLTTNIKIRVDVFSPTVHVGINSNRSQTAEVTYESWRYKDRPLGAGGRASSYKWEVPANVKTTRDEISFTNNGVSFYHRNPAITVFDSTVKHEGMESVKGQLYNPIANLTFGGRMEARNMKPSGETEGVYVDTDFKGWKLKSTKSSKSQEIFIYLHTAQTATLDEWKSGLETSIQKTKSAKNAEKSSLKWWNDFWNRSYIFINNDNVDDSSETFQAGRNYQLMRYMLGCNAFGTSPTKFNGGLFIYDPAYVNSSSKLTPDYRNWGGGTHTAQNQRLVYFPMIKSGDYDMMKSQFDFYLRILKNAELRSKVYWNHEGACFTEQMENFGLPNMVEYGMKRPAGYDKGLEYNAWLEYEWDTVLEFCLMVLEAECYNRQDISEYLPLIESCLDFFDKHYQYLAKKRGTKPLNGKGQLVLYPGSGAETFKMAYNSTSTIAGLKTITKRLLELPANYLSETKRKYLDSFLRRIPPITFTEFDGKKTIAPAQSWERINNVESPQLYTVFPYGIYGVGKPGLEIARNTFRLDTNVIKFKSHVGWKQDNIFAARLGLTEEAARLCLLKMRNSERRFPAFWGPGFDWTPDHNWGGSGMIGLQEMLMQAVDEKIYLFPAWPKDWNVHFKLHAPYQTTVEVEYNNGKVEKLVVLPEERKKDIINLLDEQQ